MDPVFHLLIILNIYQGQKQFKIKWIKYIKFKLCSSYKDNYVDDVRLTVQISKLSVRRALHVMFVSKVIYIAIKSSELLLILMYQYSSKKSTLIFNLSRSKFNYL